MTRSVPAASSFFRLFVAAALSLGFVNASLEEPWNSTAVAMRRSGTVCDPYCSSDGRYCDGIRCYGVYTFPGTAYTSSKPVDVPFCYALRYDDCHYATSPLVMLVLTLPQHRVAKAQHFINSDVFRFDVNAKDVENLLYDFIGEIDVVFHNNSLSQTVINASFQGHLNVSTSTTADRMQFTKTMFGPRLEILPELQFTANSLQERALSSYCITPPNRTAFETICDSVFSSSFAFPHFNLPTTPPVVSASDTSSGSSTVESVFLVFAALIVIGVFACIVFICVRRYRRSQLERLLLSIRGDQLESDDDAMMIDVENAIGVESDLDILAHVDDSEMQPRIAVGEPARQSAARRSNNQAPRTQSNTGHANQQPQSRARGVARTSRDGRVYIALRDDDEFSSDMLSGRSTASRVRQRGFLTDADGDDLFLNETTIASADPIVVLSASEAQSIDHHSNVIA